MTHPHLVGCLTHCGVWLIGISVGYIAAKRDWRAEAAECVLAWQRAHATAWAYIAELRAELARTRRSDLADTLVPWQTYEELVRRSGR